MVMPYSTNVDHGELGNQILYHLRDGFLDPGVVRYVSRIINMMQHIRVSLFPFHIIREDVRNQIISITEDILAALRHFQCQVKREIQEHGKAQLRLSDTNVFAEDLLPAITRTIARLPPDYASRPEEELLFMRLSQFYGQCVYQPFLEVHRQQPDHNIWLLEPHLTSLWLCLETLRSYYLCLGKLVQRNRYKLRAAIRKLGSVIGTVNQTSFNREKSVIKVRIQKRPAEGPRIQTKPMEQVGGAPILTRRKEDHNQPGQPPKTTSGTVSAEQQLAESFTANGTEMEEVRIIDKDVMESPSAIEAGPAIAPMLMDQPPSEAIPQRSKETEQERIADTLLGRTKELANKFEDLHNPKSEPLPFDVRDFAASVSHSKSLPALRRTSRVRRSGSRGRKNTV